MKPHHAAEWMFEQFEAKRFLYQEEAATHLLHLYDEELAYFGQGLPIEVDIFLGLYSSRQDDRRGGESAHRGERSKGDAESS
jgi:hypothetical protein